MLSRLSRRHARAVLSPEEPYTINRPLSVQATVAYGGWFQRTSLHLSEVYTFLVEGTSRLKLQPEALAQHHQRLDLQSVAREVSYLEYVHAITKTGIDIRYYEDGLFVLTLVDQDVDQAADRLERYYLDAWQPALTLLFSHGSPLPKELTPDSTVHPLVVAVHWPQPKTFSVPPAFGPVTSQIVADHLAVFKTPGHLFIASSRSSAAYLADLIDMHIFFREYQDQLEHYLNLHRSVWDQIDRIYQKRRIQPDQVNRYINKLQSYQLVTVNVLGRLKQMQPVARSRQGIAEELELDSYMSTLFQYSFANLIDTTAYLQTLWQMTQETLQHSIHSLDRIQQSALNSNISLLRTTTLLTLSIIVIAWMLSESFISLSPTGVGIIIAVILGGLVISWILGKFVFTRSYRFHPLQSPHPSS